MRLCEVVCEEVDEVDKVVNEVCIYLNQSKLVYW